MSKSFYTPDLSQPVALFLLKPSKTTNQGKITLTYPEPEDVMNDTKNKLIGSFKTYQGTATTYNGVTIYEDTAQVNAVYNPLVQIKDHIYLPQTNAVYEVITQPEDINIKHKYIVFKVKRVSGYGV